MKKILLSSLLISAFFVNTNYSCESAMAGSSKDFEEEDRQLARDFTEKKQYLIQDCKTLSDLISDTNTDTLEGVLTLPELTRDVLKILLDCYVKQSDGSYELDSNKLISLPDKTFLNLLECLHYLNHNELHKIIDDTSAKLYAKDQDGKYLYTRITNPDLVELIYRNFRNFKFERVLGPEKWDISSFDVSTDGEYIAYTVKQNNGILKKLEDIKVWDVKQQKYIRAWHLNTKATSLKIFNNNQYIATATDDGEVIIWNLHSGQKVRELKNQQIILNRSCQSLEISSDNQFLAVSFWDKTIEVWDLKNIKNNGQPIQTIKLNDLPQNLIFSKDKLIFNCCNDIHIYDLKASNSTTFKHANSIKSMILNDDKIIFNTINSINIQDLNGNIIKIIPTNNDIMTLSSVNETHIASITCHGKVQFWNLNSGKCVHEYRTRTSITVFAKVKISENNDLMVTTGTTPQELNIYSLPNANQKISSYKKWVYAGAALLGTAVVASAIYIWQNANNSES